MYKMLSCTSDNGRSVWVLKVKIITVPKLTRSASSLISVGADARKPIAAPGLLLELLCRCGTAKAVPAQSSSGLLLRSRGTATVWQQFPHGYGSRKWLDQVSVRIFIVPSTSWSHPSQK